jgi:dTDP-4-amino-4,6-dideoxygalactose transaminase
MAMRVPFDKPKVSGKELWYITEAHAKGQLTWGGDFTRRCNVWLEERCGSFYALLTHSRTAALEMAVILAGIGTVSFHETKNIISREEGAILRWPR